MSLKVAKTTFESGPLNKYVVADPNAVSVDNPLNNITEISNNVTNSLLGGLTGKGLISGLSDLTGGAVDLTKLNPKGIADKIKSLSPDMGSSLNGLTGTFLTDVLKAGGYVGDASAIVGNITGDLIYKGFDQVIAEQKAGIKVVLNNYEKVIKNGTLDTIKGVTDMVKGISDDFTKITVMDIAAEFGIVQTINDTAMALGIPGVPQILLNRYQSEKDKRRFVTGSLPNAITNGNLEFLDLALNTIGSNNCLATMPDMAKRIVKNYKLPVSKTWIDIQEAQHIVQVLDRLDGNWAMYIRNGIPVYNLEIFNEASDLVKEGFMLIPELRMPTMLAGKYQPVAIRDLMKKYYPYS